MHGDVMLKCFALIATGIFAVSLAFVMGLDLSALTGGGDVAISAAGPGAETGTIVPDTTSTSFP